MDATLNDQIEPLLDDLLVGIKSALGPKLVGLYLYGSLVSGGFLPDVSDLDLLAAMAGEVEASDLDPLREMHDRVARRHPAWENRIEVAYLSLAGLRTFTEHRSPLAIISPGEPLHLIDAGSDWLMNWYLVREGGRTLFGPPPATLIAPIAKAAFVESIRELARQSGVWTDRLGTRGPLAYAVLTMCRALLLHRRGEHLSKEEAAVWAREELPAWADLIDNAVRWRADPRQHAVGAEGSVPAALRFLDEVRGLIDA